MVLTEGCIDTPMEKATMHRNRPSWIYARARAAGSGLLTHGAAALAISRKVRNLFSCNYMYNNQFTVDLTVKEESRTLYETLDGNTFMT